MPAHADRSPDVPPEMPPAGSSDVPGELAQIVRLVTGLPVDQVLPPCRFVDDLRIDSLAMVEILEGAAQHFGVRIEDEAAKQFVHVGDLIDHLQAHGA